jgi:hypothetical protein
MANGETRRERARSCVPQIGTKPEAGVSRKGAPETDAPWSNRLRADGPDRLALVGAVTVGIGPIADLVGSILASGANCVSSVLTVRLNGVRGIVGVRFDHVSRVLGIRFDIVSSLLLRALIAGGKGENARSDCESGRNLLHRYSSLLW